MENLKKETLNKIADSNRTINDIVWAKIVRHPSLVDEPIVSILKVNHSEDELNDFINSLNYNYDDGYGIQEVYGTIMFKNNVWLERVEYDGSERWALKKIPSIPPSCK